MNLYFGSNWLAWGMTAVGPTRAFSQSPLPRAYRSFTGPISKVAFGSNSAPSLCLGSGAAGLENGRRAEGQAAEVSEIRRRRKPQFAIIHPGCAIRDYT